MSVGGKGASASAPAAGRPSVGWRLRLVLDRPPKALRLTKRLMKMAQRMELKDFLDLCACFQGMCHNEPEHLEAVQRMRQR